MKPGCLKRFTNISKEVSLVVSMAFSKIPLLLQNRVQFLQGSRILLAEHIKLSVRKPGEGENGSKFSQISCTTHYHILDQLKYLNSMKNSSAEHL